MLGVTLWVLLAIVFVVGTLAVLRANRLDRLHVRTDAAAAALRAALERRAVVARGIAAVLPDGAALRAAAGAAERAGTGEREAAENELARLLAGLGELPADLRAELVDAEQRLVLARRVHNDAVRDTLALRGTRLVRWLRLAGTARAPSYFEIAEEPLLGPPAGAARPARRVAARVVLLDAAGRVLLFEGADPARPDEPFWFTVGGGVHDGEQPRAAAVREVHEETGLRLPPADLVGPVWRRDVLFSFDGAAYSAREWFFVARCDGPRVDTAGFNDIERATVRRHHWWSAAELRETAAVVHPAQLAELLPTLAADWDGITRVIR